MNTTINKSKALEEEVGEKNGVEQAIPTYGDCAFRSFSCYCLFLFDSTITKDFYKGATFHYSLNLVCFFLS